VAAKKGWWQAGAGAGAAVVVVAVVFAVTQWRDADSLNSSAQDRLAAQRTAGTFSEDLLTIDSSNPGPSLDRLKSLATSSYQPKIAAAQQAAVARSSSSVRTTTTASTRDVFLTEIVDDQASAVCDERWLVTSNGRPSAPLDFYVKIDLRKVSGAWKVNGVSGLTALPSGASDGTSSSGASSTLP
jgi:hypothetical protein